MSRKRAPLDLKKELEKVNFPELTTRETTSGWNNSNKIIQVLDTTYKYTWNKYYSSYQRQRQQQAKKQQKRLQS